MFITINSMDGAEWDRAKGKHSSAQSRKCRELSLKFKLPLQT